ncbi:MAG: hypothetical protein MJY42_01820 [Bacteroidales bacterium]|nr:hypothetical protein [Bacteroidales bacterium]
MQPFVIPVKGLKDGASHFDWHADGEFFGTFENSEILDADLEISVDVNNLGTSIETECRIDGTVVVVCDRCLENLTLEVHTSFQEDEELDLSQDIYDYTCLSLPMQRVHEEGECNPETIRFLNR